VGAAALAILAACSREPSRASTQPALEREVVVYTALDRQFSEPILREFEKQTGIRVLAVYDTESTKTVGLANRIRAEKDRPRGDVFWNNEVLNTVRLKNEGLLQPSRPSQAELFPSAARDPEGCWYGLAARARVLIVNTELVPLEQMPTSVRDMADPRWKARTGIAKPLFGTTASHAAALFALLGEDEARRLFLAFKQNEVQVLGGNKGCAEMVGAGRLALALTDTDDALIELDAGRPVRIVFPDSGEGQMGTLLLPNTLALIRGCPHPAAGQRLIDYLLSAEVENRLAEGPSGQIPLHPDARPQSRLGDLSRVRMMEVDFARAAERFETAARFIEREFLAP
jgi:iron(III) transport system substrate-binding protein